MTTTPKQHPLALRLACIAEAGAVPKSTADKIAEELRRQHAEIERLTAENETLRAKMAELDPAYKTVGYTTSTITWKSDRHHSEQIVKITQHPQPEYGFVHAVLQ